MKTKTSKLTLRMMAAAMVVVLALLMCACGSGKSDGEEKGASTDAANIQASYDAAVKLASNGDAASGIESNFIFTAVTDGSLFDKYGQSLPNNKPTSTSMTEGKRYVVVYYGESTPWELKEVQ